MIFTGIRNLEVWPDGELSNDDYHKNDGHISPSGLHTFHDKCPASYKYREQETTPALEFGTASHAKLLEPKLFADSYIRGIDKNEEGMITSELAARTAIKEAGRECKTTIKGDDLAKLLIDTIPDAKYFKLLVAEQEKYAKAKNLVIVKAADFDATHEMREIIHSQPHLAQYLTGDQTVELSIKCEVELDGEWYKVKVRPDLISGGMLIDYKTTQSAKPDEFARHAHRLGYWFKSTMIEDVFNLAYPDSPHISAYLAQEKKSPYIPEMYLLSEAQKRHSRASIAMALKYYKMCEESDNWPSYNNGQTLELETPPYIKIGE